MPTIAVTIVDQTVAVTQAGEIGPIGATGTVSAAGDGTAAAPGIAFATDTDTGLFRPGVNTLAASTGGTERARIDASGNVGIGTASPGSILDVQGASIGASFAGLTIRDAAAERVRIGYSTGGAPTAGLVSPQILYGQVESSGGLMLTTRGNVQAGMGFYTSPDAGVTGLVERMRITSGGNVGINQIAPNSANKLEVNGDISTSWGAAVNTLIGMRYLDGANYELGMRLLEATRETRITSKAADGAGLISFYTGTTPTEKMRITSDGNVGIGTTSPVTKLTNSTSKTTGTVSDSGLNWNINEAATFAVGIKNASGTGKGLHVESGGGHALIVEGGNVGIGTASPDVFGRGYSGKILGISSSGQSAIELNSATGSGAYFDMGVNGTRILSVYADSTSSSLTTVGAQTINIATGGAADLTFGTNSAERIRISSSGQVTPGADNTQNLGSASLRWATIYAGTGTINTSDERYKVLREGGDLTDAEFAAWSNVRAIVYQDKDAFERKGSAARLHIGYSWQSIQAAFEAEGLDAGRYGLWCEDALEAPVEKTRMASRPVEGQTETIPVLDDDGLPVVEQVQATEAVEQPFEEVRVIAGKPVLVKGTRTVEQPLFDSVQVEDEGGELLFEMVQAKNPETGEALFDSIPALDEDGVPIFDTVQDIDPETGELIFDQPDPVEDPETGEPVEGDPVPRMIERPRMTQTPRMAPAPRTAPVPRMISKAKTETVPVMEDVEETYTEMEPTGETRGALRYNQCSVIEAAWLRRELASLTARIAALEAA